jgi:hypothetical protein
MNLNPLLNELAPGESVVWQGKPHKWLFITTGPLHEVLFVPFSLAWGGFFACLEVFAIHAGSVGGALLFAPFLLVGLYLIGGRFWMGKRCWENTYYLITNTRVLVRVGAVNPRVTSLDFAKICSVHLHAKRLGLGHINLNSGGCHVFGSIYPWQPGASWAIINGLVVTIPSFRYIRDPENVYETLRSMLASGNGSRSRDLQGDQRGDDLRV